MRLLLWFYLLVCLRPPEREREMTEQKNLKIMKRKKKKWEKNQLARELVIVIFEVIVIALVNVLGLAFFSRSFVRSFGVYKWQTAECVCDNKRCYCEPMLNEEERPSLSNQWEEAHKERWLAQTVKVSVPELVIWTVNTHEAKVRIHRRKEKRWTEQNTKNAKSE